MRGRVRTAPRDLVGAAKRVVRPASSLLVPVPEAATALRVWQGAAELPGAVPAHITVMYPFLPPHTIDGMVEAQLARIAALVRPFRFTLTEVGRFPGVLYLRPVPAEPFADLAVLVMRRWPACRPYRGKYPEYIPHLALATGEAARGDTDRLTPLLPITCRATEVALMTENVRGWHTRSRFPLRGTAP